jgi:diaminopimelate decarboxylase
MQTMPLTDIASAIPVPLPNVETPRRLFVERAAVDRFSAVRRTCEALSLDTGLAIIRAYSVKTNPSHRMLALARDQGFFAEVISADECVAAQRANFPFDQLIYNGPEPPLLSALGTFGFCFADSVEAFARNALLDIANVAGIRLRPSMIQSRFGVPLEDRSMLEGAVRRAAVKKIACSLHARREDFRGASWVDVCADTIERAAHLERATGSAVVAFDVGGGWQPHEFDQSFASDARLIVERIRQKLQNVRHLIIEPGQAIATPSEAIVGKVLEVRPRGGRREVVIDVGYNDWSQQHSFRHRLFVSREGVWQPVGAGGDRVGGKTCLEYDVVDGLRFPEAIESGDFILIADVGAYDASMAFSFARANRQIAVVGANPG